MRGDRDKVVAGLGVVSVNRRVPPEREEELVEVVVDAARELSRLISLAAH